MPQPLRRGEPYRPKNWRRIGFKLSVISSLNRFPPLKQLLRYMWKNISILRYRWRSRKLATALGDDFDVDRIYWVEPVKKAQTN